MPTPDQGWARVGSAGRVVLVYRVVTVGALIVCMQLVDRVVAYCYIICISGEGNVGLLTFYVRGSRAM